MQPPTHQVHQPRFPTGNAWLDAPVDAGGLSSVIDLGHFRAIWVFGRVDAATTLTLLASSDGQTFREASPTHCRPISLDGPRDFAVAWLSAGRFVRLRSSAAARLMATVVAKSWRRGIAAAALGIV